VIGSESKPLAFMVPSYRKHLTGFSHGTAGVAYALLELFQATGDTKYRRGAELAFNYERRWFDASAGNWPDFREEPGARKRGNDPWPCATAWCHGAPGIGLSRLRAYEVLRDATCKDEALIALETTRSWIESALRSGTCSFCLCHGLAGNADLLLQGRLVLGEAGERTGPLHLKSAISVLKNTASKGCRGLAG
jgi:lantibiotic modifying enzyme